MDISHISWDFLRENAANFHLDTDKFDRLREFFDRCDQKYLGECAAKVNNGFPLQEVVDRFPEADLCKFLLFCIVANAPAMAEYYRVNNLPQQMFDEISYDLLIWVNTLERDLGFYGLTPRIFAWEAQCLNGEVKQFGRLQANDLHTFVAENSIVKDRDGNLQIVPLDAPDSAGEKLLTLGDKVYTLHIPASGRMDRQACLDSLRRIMDFAAEYHPEFDYKAIVCYSWILDPQFETFLPPDANLIQFQKLGHLFPLTSDETREIIWRIWGKPGLDMPVAQLPARTSMEKGVKQFVLNGGRFTEYLLVIFRDELPELLS
ncbi:MAG: hypothetical protein E7058_06000 [Lentisphaerae bacterium]|nr:hypothetical protein [Lentisphaerota bacterium]